ncbi:MAG TPA: carboxypeptidase regulatory-like domain-containing protein [Candidatus Saccharimonadales bacterium]|jgi:plastocyanin|nr:carboxypeptidase regulatory-like domain-containing protein [Candidatus Saccharimonadales bacterium]
MNIRQHAFAAFALIAGVVCIAAQPRGYATESGIAVSGEATLAGPETGGVAKDASRIVVWLSLVDAVRPVRATTERPHYRLVQHNKRFEPGLLVVPVGSVVDFPNLDPWFHNVFSLYRGKRFDLGLYQAGAQRSVRFDRIGPSYLFCNIHPEMTGVVLAIDSDLFAVTDKSGHYAITGLTPGKYVLHVWYENATQESLQALQRLVTIQSDDHILPAISVKALMQIPEHKNKYGQDYDPATLKTDY